MRCTAPRCVRAQLYPAHSPRPRKIRASEGGSDRSLLLFAHNGPSPRQSFVPRPAIWHGQPSHCRSHDICVLYWAPVGCHDQASERSIGIAWKRFRFALARGGRNAAVSQPFAHRAWALHGMKRIADTEHRQFHLRGSVRAWMKSRVRRPWAADVLSRSVLPPVQSRRSIFLKSNYQPCRSQPGLLGSNQEFRLTSMIHQILALQLGVAAAYYGLSVGLYPPPRQIRGSRSEGSPRNATLRLFAPSV